MKLAGDLKEFSLPDFLQIQCASGRTAEIKVLSPDGVGMVYLEGGRPVHAEYGDLEGERALLGLLAVRSGYFETTAERTTARRSVEAPLTRLLLDLTALEKAGLVPRPSSVRRAVPASDGKGERSASRLDLRADPGIAAAAAAPAPARRGPALTVLALAALAGLGILGWLAFGRQVPPLEAKGTPQVTQVPIEITELHPPADVLPRLLAGGPPVPPASDLAVVPTIVCRVLLNEAGEVVEARVFRSRLELAAFEEAAVAAVHGYRFSAALRDGKPVPVWLNWSVGFH